MKYSVVLCIAIMSGVVIWGQDEKEVEEELNATSS
jgi:hypothetical protein